MNNSSRSDFDALRKLSDEEIDYSDVRPLDSNFFARAELRIPAAQAQLFVRLDPDVVAWFRSQGREFENLINAALREHMATH